MRYSSRCRRGRSSSTREWVGGGRGRRQVLGEGVGSGRRGVEKGKKGEAGKGRREVLEKRMRRVRE